MNKVERESLNENMNKIQEILEKNDEEIHSNQVKVNGNPHVSYSALIYIFSHNQASNA